MTIINLFADNGKSKSTIKIVSFVALIISLAPLLVNCYSVVSRIISVLLSVVFIISLKKEEIV